MKSIITWILIFVCSTISSSQTNIIDTSSWFEGSGSVSGFSGTGSSIENIREMGIGPHGNSVLLWKTVPEVTGNSGAGGWTTDLIDIDHNKTYRFTVWFKKTNSFDGTTYFRAKAEDDSGNTTVNFLSGGANTNPYFLIGDPPTLDEWYLLVGFMHQSAYTNTVSVGGLYSGATGVKMLNCSDFKFQSTATKIEQTVWLGSNNNSSDTEFFYGPTLYEVNGQEPSIQDLINGQPDNQAPSKPTLSSIGKSNTTVDLSWSGAIDNFSVTAYKVYKNGVIDITLGNVSTYQVTGLAPATSYNFTVTALDASDNESIVSNTIIITTDTNVSNSGSGYWSLNNQDVYYNTGNVGIGTNIPDSKLTVKGSIHSEEVKVDLSVPAPDYVFESGYSLTPLEKLQEYIITHGHLPNVPSAKDMETHGIELGIMNMKLLEKIEELTLYILQQQRELYLQSEKSKTLENRLIKLETLIKK